MLLRYHIVESFLYWTHNSWRCWCFGKRHLQFNGSKQFTFFHTYLIIFQYFSVEFFYAIQQKLHDHLHPILLQCYVECTFHFGMLFWIITQGACTYVILVVVFCAFAALSSIFLALIETSIAWYLVRCHKNGGPAQWWKIRGVQNFRGSNFQGIIWCMISKNSIAQYQKVSGFDELRMRE